MNKYAHLENYVSELRKTAADYAPISESTVNTAIKGVNINPLTGADYDDYANNRDLAKRNSRLSSNWALGSALAGIGGIMAPTILEYDNPGAGALLGLGGIGAAIYGAHKASKFQDLADKHSRMALNMDPFIPSSPSMLKVYNKIVSPEYREMLEDDTPTARKYLGVKRPSFYNPVTGEANMSAYKLMRDDRYEREESALDVQRENVRAIRNLSYEVGNDLAYRRARRRGYVY